MKAIAAMSRNRVIGIDGKLPWHLPKDFKWFKRCTSGQAVVMGRKTFESLGRPLPNRLNLVATRGEAAEGTVKIGELATLRDEDYAPRELWVIGGAEIYRQLLPRCSDLYLSVVDREVDGDAFFPPFEDHFTLADVPLRCEEFEVRHYRNVNGGL